MGGKGPGSCRTGGGQEGKGFVVVCCAAGEIVAGVFCTLCRGCQAGELLGSVLHPLPCRDMIASTRPHRTGARETGQKEQSTIQTRPSWGLLPHEHHTPKEEPHKGSSCSPMQLCTTLHTCCRGRAQCGPAALSARAGAAAWTEQTAHG